MSDKDRIQELELLVLELQTELAALKNDDGLSRVRVDGKLWTEFTERPIHGASWYDLTFRQNDSNGIYTNGRLYPYQKQWRFLTETVFIKGDRASIWYMRDTPVEKVSIKKFRKMLPKWREEVLPFIEVMNSQSY